jgi:hypothetical protein
MTIRRYAAAVLRRRRLRFAFERSSVDATAKLDRRHGESAPDTGSRAEPSGEGEGTAPKVRLISKAPCAPHLVTGANFRGAGESRAGKCDSSYG